MRREPETSTGGCVPAMAVGLLFPDDSVVRPDLAVFCRQPERRELITLVPEAVVEIVSQRSREKDLEISPPWYLRMGVKDVLVYDPFTEDVHHFRADGHALQVGPHRPPRVRLSRGRVTKTGCHGYRRGHRTAVTRASKPTGHG